jgi:hypothetical protein
MVGSKPSNTSLELSGGKLWGFHNNCETWWIWVHLCELWMFDPNFNYTLIKFSLQMKFGQGAIRRLYCAESQKGES